uniref:7TM_GPCR_Srx domain-containing protein n=1 Tax=Caenorhabditis tropicalis TaxID=1561998 RepID=A0A1I7UAT7_9PELO
MDNSTVNDPLSWTAAALMSLNGVFGITMNAIVVHNFVSTPIERTSFNLICAFRAAVNIIILILGFLATFVPLTLYGDSLFPPVHHAIVITIVNSLYTGLQNCGFLVAVNRFFAMFFMVFYSKYFTVSVTFFLTSAVFAYRIFRIVQDIDQNIQTKCFSTYVSEYLSWRPTRNPDCLNKYADVVDGSIIILIALVVINTLTFMKIYIFYKKTDLNSKDVKTRMRKNRILFAQTIFQDLTYLIDMLFTFNLRYEF